MLLFEDIEGRMMMSEMLMTMVMMSIKNLKPGVWVRCTEATFVMVARDPLNKTASFVNPLKLVTSDEKEVFQRGIENKKRYFFPLLLSCCKGFSIIHYHTQTDCLQDILNLAGGGHIHRHSV